MTSHTPGHVVVSGREAVDAAACDFAVLTTVLCFLLVSHISLMCLEYLHSGLVGVSFHFAFICFHSRLSVISFCPCSMCIWLWSFSSKLFSLCVSHQHCASLLQLLSPVPSELVT